MDAESIQARIKADPYNHRLYAKLARAYMDEGEEHRAREIVVARRKHAPDDPAAHIEWARLCEELGMAKQAKDSYRAALRLSPDNSENLYQYARLLNDLGYYEDSIHYLEKAVKNDPGHAQARNLLGETFRALGLEGLADALLPRPGKPAPPVRYFPPSVGREDADKFLRLFSGRETGYALQKVNENTGSVSYEFRGDPLTRDLVVKHIQGDLTLALFPLRADNTVRYAGVRVRIKKRVIRSNARNTGYLAYLKERSFYHASTMRGLAAGRGVPCYIDFSGGHEHRVWFFFRGFVHFLKAREFIKRFLEEAALSDTEIIAEPLTPTKGVGIGWVEHPVTPPLGINRATLKRSLFLDDTGDPYPEQLAFLKKIREIPFDEVRKLFGKPRWARPESSSGVEMEGIVKKLVEACPVLSELCRIARSGRVLPYEKKVVLFYTIGLADHRGVSLHRVLETCPDYNYDKVERQRTRLKPHPISCVKIRELVPEITTSVSCNCPFDLRGGKYPSPLLHINPHLVPASKDIALPRKVSLREAARRYVNLRRQAEEIERAMEKTARVLDRHFDRRGIDRVRVGGSVLYRKKQNGSSVWEIGS